MWQDLPAVSGEEYEEDSVWKGDVHGSIRMHFLLRRFELVGVDLTFANAAGWLAQLTVGASLLGQYTSSSEYWTTACRNHRFSMAVAMTTTSNTDKFSG